MRFPIINIFRDYSSSLAQGEWNFPTQIGGRPGNGNVLPKSPIKIPIRRRKSLIILQPTVTFSLLVLPNMCNNNNNSSLPVVIPWKRGSETPNQLRCTGTHNLEGKQRSFRIPFPSVQTGWHLLRASWSIQLIAFHHHLTLRRSPSIQLTPAPSVNLKSQFAEISQDLQILSREHVLRAGIAYLAPPQMCYYLLIISPASWSSWIVHIFVVFIYLSNMEIIRELDEATHHSFCA